MKKKKKKYEKFLRHITSINFFKVCRIRNLTLEDKITFFKALAMSKIVHLVLITNVPTLTMK